MNFAYFAVAFAAFFAVYARAESHRVELINKCGRGKPVFLYQGHSTPQGSTTVNGQLLGGVAWLSGTDNCQSSGVNCGIVEFSLTNPSNSRNTQNAADYSLLNKPEWGNHQYKYPMYFEFTGSCTKKAPGSCTGHSRQKCPGGYLDSTTDGSPVQCVSNDAGIRITFC